MKSSSHRAFTLIELLVVVSIIGLLSTLVVVALKNVRNKALDARRLADMRQIRTALELYYDKFNTFPTTSSYNENGSGGWDYSTADIDGDGQYFMEFLEDNNFIGKVPVDPKNDASHYYRYYFYGGTGVAYTCVRPFWVVQAFGFEARGGKGDEGVCYTPGSCANNDTCYTMMGKP
ncbi:MAG TPA: type II secretion system protein [Candidatus Paceibacterota bacterium]|nr:type II secretion system protein [Candidatus Paceibacterota bacterium]